MIFPFFGNRKPSRLRLDSGDREFDLIYPKSVRRHAEQHFTSLSVALKASAFLVERPQARVLDIGSGAGKFCLIGAATTTGHFTGIEQRPDLVKLSNRIASSYSIRNTTFIHGNILTADFHAYDAFYMFNPFFENVSTSPRMDEKVLSNPALFGSYSSFVYERLGALRQGTRLATYYTSPSLVPASYSTIEISPDAHLRFYIKTG